MTATTALISLRTALPLSHFLVASLFFSTTFAQTNSTTTNDTTSNDGSGVGPEYRRNASFLLFAIQSLVVGGFLLGFGKRCFRITTGLGLGLLLQLIVWVGIVNSLGVGGFSGASQDHTSIIIWAIVFFCSLVGVAFGSWFWVVGMVAMAGCGGLSLALSIIMMGNDDLAGNDGLARYIILAVVTLVVLILAPLLHATVGMSIATALTGAFLFFFGVDLLVNQTNGMSLGLRYLFDRNSAHAADLQTYLPPISTRVLLVLIWSFALLFTAFQTWIYSNHPFVKSRASSAYAKDLDVESLEGNSELADRDLGATEMLSNDNTITSRMQQRYEAAADDKSRNLESPSGSHMRMIEGDSHLREMSSPDSPPSRPSSVVSTRLANGLRSRPPTFFNEPLGDAPSHHATDFSAFAPVAAVGALGAAGIIAHKAAERRDSDDTTTGLPQASPTELASHRRPGSLDSQGSHASRESRKSYRKPVPSNLMVGNGGRNLDDDQDFSRGLSSGRDASLAPSNGTPSSDVTSFIMSPTFSRSDNERARAAPPVLIIPAHEQFPKETPEIQNFAGPQSPLSTHAGRGQHTSVYVQHEQPLPSPMAESFRTAASEMDLGEEEQERLRP